MVYLRMAVHRLKKDEQLKVLPSLLNALKANLADKNVVDQIILLTAGGWLRLAEMNAEKWPDLNELNDPSIRSAVLKFFSDILAFPYPVGDLATFVTRVEATRMVNLSCISISTYLKIAKDLFVAASLSITDVKVAVLKVLSSKYFTDKDCLPLLPLGLANGCNEVEFAADSCMKRIDQPETLKDRGVINKLFTLYLGNPSKVSLKMQRGDRME
ncbi:unnamed protein product [Anisakis simplex]|uniref:Proteasome-associated protein ECM29 homolog (inferred by orthology to a human protein) n=1 Tax=Anisakis simplex TaxID=6269 RepID=A0A0M3J968_ANISI|nr:unnamed protein product [Anisakis simplex]